MTYFSHRTVEAIILMISAHHGQNRKFTGEPYACHPLRVAHMVSMNGGSEDMIVAALLHDLVEDTSVPINEIYDQFGEHVAMLTRP